MPRFYFHLHSSVGFTPDEEGRELPDLGAAQTYAIVNIRSILQEDVGDGMLDLRGRIDIADGGGGTLSTVPFSHAVALQLDGERP